MRVAGQQGAVELHPFGPEPKLRITRGGYADLADVTPAQLPEGSIEIAYAVGKFVEAIRQGKPSPVPGDTFMYTNLIFDGLYASSRQGREVAVPLPGA